MRTRVAGSTGPIRAAASHSFHIHTQPSLTVCRPSQLVTALQEATASSQTLIHTAQPHPGSSAPHDTRTLVPRALTRASSRKRSCSEYDSFLNKAGRPEVPASVCRAVLRGTAGPS
jgi:hypothetical protein